MSVFLAATAVVINQARPVDSALRPRPRFGRDALRPNQARIPVKVSAMRVETGLFR